MTDTPAHSTLHRQHLCCNKAYHPCHFLSAAHPWVYHLYLLRKRDSEMKWKEWEATTDLSSYPNPSSSWLCDGRQTALSPCPYPHVGNNTLFFFFFKHLYWSIIALQWCVSFCCMTKWISYTYTYIPISPPSCISLPPSLSHPFRWTQSTELISLCYVAASH